MVKNSYIDTQGMTLPGEVPTKYVEHQPMPVKEMKVFTDLERKELKQIIHEVLDERDRSHETESNEWLYRGTY